MKKIIFLFIALSSISVSYALDTSSAFNQHTGTYAEINVGPNLYYAGIYSSEGSAKTAGIQGFGWSGAVGYNLTNIFAFEGGFMQNYANILVDDSFETGNEYKYAHTNVPYVTTRFNVPIDDRFSFIGKLGVMYVSVPNSGGVALPYVGVGGSYAFNHSWDFTVQYQGAVYGIAGAGLMSAGLTYHFG